MDSKYKIGDVVKIVDISQFVNCRNRNPSGEMDHWAGKEMTIRNILRDMQGYNKYYMYEDIDETTCNTMSGWVWDDTMIECLVDKGIIDINQDDLMNFLEG